MAANKTLTNNNRGNETLAAAVTDVSERVTVLIREEIELAKAETVAKISSLARGLVAVGAGAVFGVFALIIALVTLAWGLDSFIAGTGKIWIGFMIVTAVLVALAVAAFLFAWRKLKVGAPTPKMAIEEAKKISATVRNGSGEAKTNGAQPAPVVPSQTTAPTSPTPTATSPTPPAASQLPPAASQLPPAASQPPPAASHPPPAASQPPSAASQPKATS
jgi:hypothetical protein